MALGCLQQRWQNTVMRPLFQQFSPLTSGRCVQDMDGVQALSCLDPLEDSAFVDSWYLRSGLNKVLPKSGSRSASKDSI
jgi:hypothetical protein